MGTVRLTVGQAIVRFMAEQYIERDGVQTRFIAGVWGIFGHGNVAGLGQALEELGDEYAMPYYRPQNEQAQVHLAAAYAKHKNRLQTFACISSIGPGATNMITGAARRHGQPPAGPAVPVGLLREPPAGPGAPADRAPGRARRLGVRRLPPRLAATSTASPAPSSCCPACPEALPRPDRPGRDRRGHDLAARGRAVRGLRLAGALLRAPRLAGPPAAPGAPRSWPRSVDLIRAPSGRSSSPAAAPSTPAPRRRSTSSRPRYGIPVSESQAGKGVLPWNHPLNVGPIGAAGGLAANRLAKDADLVIAVGTRLGDFVTASKTAVPGPGRRRSSASTSTGSTPPSSAPSRSSRTPARR